MSTNFSICFIRRVLFNFLAFFVVDGWHSCSPLSSGKTSAAAFVLKINQQNCSRSIFLMLRKKNSSEHESWAFSKHNYGIDMESRAASTSAASFDEITGISFLLRPKEAPTTTTMLLSVSRFPITDGTVFYSLILLSTNSEKRKKGNWPT